MTVSKANHTFFMYTIETLKQRTTLENGQIFVYDENPENRTRIQVGDIIAVQAIQTGSDGQDEDADYMETYKVSIIENNKVEFQYVQGYTLSQWQSGGARKRKNRKTKKTQKNFRRGKSNALKKRHRNKRTTKRSHQRTYKKK